MKNYKSTKLSYQLMKELTFEQKLEAIRSLKGSVKIKRQLSKEEFSNIIKKEYGIK